MTGYKGSITDGEIAKAAEARWGKRCPCCDRPMQRYKIKAGQSIPSDMRTVGHDRSVALGGDPNIWVYICNRCNSDQGSLPFEVWARKLFRCGDPRMVKVLELTVFIRQLEKGRETA